MGFYTALVLALGMLVEGLTELPIGPASLRQTAWDCGLAAFAGLLRGRG